MEKRTQFQAKTGQRGAALLVGLILLAVTTMIAVVAMGSTVLQERMTGAQRNDSLAHQGAESALRGGELQLWADYVANDGRLASGSAAQPENLNAQAGSFREDPGWVTGGASEYSGIGLDALASHGGAGRLAKQPLLMIERLRGTGCLESHCGGASTGGGSVGMVDYFRITARSTGGDERVIRASESTYAMGR